MSKPVFVYVSYIASTPDKVFKALTSHEATTKFWFGNAAHLRLESRLADRLPPRGQADSKGEVLENDPPRRLSYTFKPMHEPHVRQRTALAGRLRPRTAARSGQAHRHPRRFHRRQQGFREHQQRLAAGSVQPQKLLETGATPLFAPWYEKTRLRPPDRTCGVRQEAGSPRAARGRPSSFGRGDYRKLALILSSADCPGHSSFFDQRVERSVHGAQMRVHVVGVLVHVEQPGDDRAPWTRGAAESPSAAVRSVGS